MQKPLSRFPEKICSEISPHREIIETIFEAIFETESILMLAKSSEALNLNQLLVQWSLQPNFVNVSGQVSWCVSGSLFVAIVTLPLIFCKSSIKVNKENI